MKTATKVFLAISAFFVVIGIALCSISLATGSIVWSKLTTDIKYETVEHTFNASEITKVSIQSSNADVSFEKTDDDKITVYTSEYKKLTYDVTFTDGKLTVEVSNSLKWYDRISFSFGSSLNKIRIALPDNIIDSLGDISIETSSGDVSLSGFTADSVKVSASSGEIYMKSAVVNDKITLGSSSGDIHLVDCDIEGTLAISVSSGDSVIDGGKFGKDVEFNASSAQLVVKDAKISGNLTADTSSGEISLRYADIAGKVEIETSSGDVTLRGLKAGNIDIETSSGEIEGTLYGRNEYIIDARSSNGDEDVPSSATGSTKEMKLRTSSGDIDISFAD